MVDASRGFKLVEGQEGGGVAAAGTRRPGLVALGAGQRAGVCVAGRARVFGGLGVAYCAESG